MSNLRQGERNYKASFTKNLLLTIVTMTFSEVMEKKGNIDENTLDVHVDIENKIDRIIEKSENSNSFLDEEDINNISLKDQPVEFRSSLSKKINNNSVEFGIKPKNSEKSIFNNNLNPGIFASEINEIDFITEIAEIYEKYRDTKILDDKLEVIDFNSFSSGEIKNETKTTIISLEKPKDQENSEKKPKTFNIGGLFNKKAEPNKTKSKNEGLFNFIQSKKSNEKSKVYFLKESQNKVEKSESETTNFSKNIDDELKELKQKEQDLIEARKKVLEEEKKAEKLKKLKEKEALVESKKRAAKREQRNKIIKERQRQEEKLRKLEMKKAELEKKERERIAKKESKKRDYEFLYPDGR